MAEGGENRRKQEETGWEKRSQRAYLFHIQARTVVKVILATKVRQLLLHKVVDGEASTHGLAVVPRCLQHLLLLLGGRLCSTIVGRRRRRRSKAQQPTMFC